MFTHSPSLLLVPSLLAALSVVASPASQAPSGPTVSPGWSWRLVEAESVAGSYLDPSNQGKLQFGESEFNLADPIEAGDLVEGTRYRCSAAANRGSDLEVREIWMDLVPHNNQLRTLIHYLEEDRYGIYRQAGPRWFPAELLSSRVPDSEPALAGTWSDRIHLGDGLSIRSLDRWELPEFALSLDDEYIPGQVTLSFKTLKTVSQLAGGDRLVMFSIQHPSAEALYGSCLRVPNSITMEVRYQRVVLSSDSFASVLRREQRLQAKLPRVMERISCSDFQSIFAHATDWMPSIRHLELNQPDGTLLQSGPISNFDRAERIGPIKSSFIDLSERGSENTVSRRISSTFVQTVRCDGFSQYFGFETNPKQAAKQGQ
jgi:hypothetical protein